MLTEKEEQQQLEQAGSSSSAAAADSGLVDVDVEALELLGQGKRNLVVGDPPAAVQCLQEACALLAANYGEMADECGEAYYQYGCALLDLASMENGVLGNALEGVPDESADSDEDEESEEKPSGSNVESADTLGAKEREEVIQQVQDALEEACETEESEKEDDEKKGDGEKNEDMETDEGGDKKEEEEKEEGDEKEDSKKGGDEKKDEEKVEKKDEDKVEKKDDKSKVEKEDEDKVEKKDDKSKVEKEDDKSKVEMEGKVEKEVEERKDEKGAEGDANKTDKKTEEAKTEKKDDEDEGAGPSTEPDTTEGEDDDGEKSDQKDPDDVSNFQLAWEMLELARLIIGRQEAKDCQLKVSQIHLKLGELGLETEQYPQSVVDFNYCLEIQKKFLDPESRLLAGTHYNLGLAYCFDQKFDESIENYRQSKQLIEKRLASLEKKVSETEGKGKEKADEENPLVKNQKEIDELKELLPDIVSKLEDVKEMKLQGGVGGGGGDGAGPSSSSSSGFAQSSSSSGFAPSTSSAPVQQITVKKTGGDTHNISHLVRRKRKPEEGDGDDAATTAESKRSRQEEGEKSAPEVNGAGDAQVANGNGHMNGDALPNGDTKYPLEKPSELKAKKMASGETAAAMDTA